MQEAHDRPQAHMHHPTGQQVKQGSTNSTTHANHWAPALDQPLTVAQRVWPMPTWAGAVALPLQPAATSWSAARLRRALILPVDLTTSGAPRSSGGVMLTPGTCGEGGGMPAAVGGRRCQCNMGSTSLKVVITVSWLYSGGKQRMFEYKVVDSLVAYAAGASAVQSPAASGIAPCGT
jgi:hypothetical protein